ncbi:hydroxymethylglutaryl-CoA reductase, degradative [Rhodovulum euryhalinum]|uniref:3-hydroxy-3-methylglutaryl coenzyme A reductase n=1 Tax=Rhodovulum euryhalinum TaxID=35805 RepID=A0A4R2KNL7_9RHOB|nr:hydroxymethylglutaryl-CoA reductase, degradative [Rhodovulum euryhalinum]TCO74177.1 3-hydroxy-3-methylglutaryl-coenzyme A reductase [Rhodovulum euryhalinum]
MTDPTSRLPGFGALTRADRLRLLDEATGLALSDKLAETGPVEGALVERLIENAVGVMPVPLGVATNMRVDGRDVLVPMATEESSVIAAVGNAAKRCRGTGGFFTSYSGSLTIAQIQIVGLADPQAARLMVLERFDDLAALCAEIDPMLHKLGGGLCEVEARVLDAPSGPMLVVHLVVDTRDAMGANTVNSMAEAAGPRIAEWTGGRALFRILSNLADRRVARARATWPAAEIGGPDVVEAMCLGAEFAAVDPYRATTHNKGIMNGVSAVVLATGNDTRAIEAGAHAYAARSGRYTALSRWEKTAAGDLAGSIELPLSLGLVGGATRVHPVAQASLALLGVDSAGALARIVAAVGLAQNFGALRALATEGIQSGHMALHAQNVAIAAGAVGDEIERVARQLRDRRQVRQDVAEEVLAHLRGR